MFIPPGESIHEKLATSYVLVDALVADLCEGGFSGVIEVVLRNTDSFIVIVNGNVSAVIEKSSDHAKIGTTSAYTRITVDQLAECSRRERGRVSIYGYSAATASAVAGRINAKPLYVGLSTEFTDLEKMISKLVRERDREWFIEFNTESGPGALIHMRDTECRIISSTGYADSGSLDLANNVALGHLLDECNRAGGTFDVSFTQAADKVDVSAGHASPQPIPSFLPGEDGMVDEEPVELHLGVLKQAASGSLTWKELFSESREPQRPVSRDFDEPSLAYEERRGVSNNVDAARAATQSSFMPPSDYPTSDAGNFIEPRHEDLLLLLDEHSPNAADAEAMAEIKRLMAEIARTIEQAAQAVDRPDSFSMSLRAGQLKIADRFPFLDPFAGEFEYLAGEIVFVGRATAAEFVAGLTEALKLAVDAVTRSTAYADKFRAYVIEDLQKLLARDRFEFERFGLDEVIEQLLKDDL